MTAHSTNNADEVGEAERQSVDEYEFSQDLYVEQVYEEIRAQMAQEVEITHNEEGLCARNSSVPEPTKSTFSVLKQVVQVSHVEAYLAEDVRSENEVPLPLTSPSEEAIDCNKEGNNESSVHSAPRKPAIGRVLVENNNKSNTYIKRPVKGGGGKDGKRTFHPVSFGGLVTDAENREKDVSSPLQHCGRTILGGAKSSCMGVGLRKKTSLPELRPGDKTLTLALLERTAFCRRHPIESVEKWVSKTTHLHVEGRNLTRLGGLILPKIANLRYLYAYDNRIEFLDPLPKKLETIYLDNNEISEIDLSYLTNLRILSISHNRLTQIESLARCPLEELHIARQPMVPSVNVMRGLSITLKVLNMSACQLRNLDFMKPLKKLENLNVTCNYLETVEEVVPVLECLLSLQKLRVAGNPFCRQQKYRDSIVYSCRGNLAELDERSVSPLERQFLLKIIPKRKSSKESTSSSYQKINVYRNQRMADVDDLVHADFGLVKSN